MDKKKLYDIIDGDYNIKAGIVYNFVMMIAIFVSLVPLAFKKTNLVFELMDKITVVLFIVDYILRIITADIKLKKGKLSFFVYPFTPMAIIDLISIMPSLTLVSSAFRLLRTLRLLRTFRVLKAFKMFRYSRSMSIISEVIKKQKTPLMAVGTFAAGYVLVAALLVFNVEPDTFKNYFEAVYWATVSLTTVGYGDIYPVSSAGRIVTMISSFMGVAIVALPSGVITAGYLEELKNYNFKDK